MAMSMAPSVRRRPWHLWVLGIVNLLWTLMGCVDFTLTNALGDGWLRQAGLNEAQIATYHAMPLWQVVGWGVGVFGGVLGSVLLLMRRKLAAPVLTISLVGAVASQVPSMLDPAFRAAMEGAAFMGVAIIVWAAVIALYAWVLSESGILGRRPPPSYAFN